MDLAELVPCTDVFGRAGQNIVQHCDGLVLAGGSRIKFGQLEPALGAVLLDLNELLVSGLGLFELLARQIEICYRLTSLDARRINFYAFLELHFGFEVTVGVDQEPAIFCVTQC